MSLGDEVLRAGQAVTNAAGEDLAAALNRFVAQFAGWPFRANGGFVRANDGGISESFASVIHTTPDAVGTIEGEGIPADGVAAVIDACESLDVAGLRAAYARVARAKRLNKSPAPVIADVAVTTVTLGIVLGLRSDLPMEAIAEELERLNAATPGRERPDMVVVASTGVINYAVQWPGEGVSGDFLPPGEGATTTYTVPWYIVMVTRPTVGYSLNKMLGFLLPHLGLFSPGAALPSWIEVLKDVPPHGVLVCGYQYNQSGDLVAVPRNFYNDRYLAPQPVRIEDKLGHLLATLQFLPWQDGGAILLRGKLPLEGLLVFLRDQRINRRGALPLKGGQISFVLPITADDFGQFLSAIRRKTNMVVRREEKGWVVKKMADEGSSSPIMARLLIGLVRLRDAGVPDPLARDAFDKALDSVIRSVLSARSARDTVVATWKSHANGVASGTIARVRGPHIHVDANADSALAREFDAFLTAATRTIKSGMQALATELSTDLGCLFQRQATFEAGLAALHTTDPALAEYLTHSRLWSERLVGRRNAVEHEGWRLPEVIYERAGAGVHATEPSIDGQPASDFVTFMFDRLACFVEEVATHCLQQRLPLGITFTEIPLSERDSDMPLRFRVTVTTGGLPPWKLRFHDSPFDQT